MNCSLSFIELRVSAWQTSLAWYREVLGLPVLLRVDADQFALLSAGPVRLALAHGDPQPGGVLLAFEVEDLTTWVDTLARRGVELDGPLKTSPEGYRRARLRDPDGHLLTLFEWMAGTRGTPDEPAQPS